MDPAYPPALLAALALLLVPGGALAHLLGFRGLWWLALAPVISVAAVGATGVVAAPLRVPFHWWEPPVVVAVACAAILIVRAFRHLPLQPRRAGRWGRWDLVITAVVLVTAVASAAIVVSGIGPADRISQTYDGLFHLNAVAWIRSTGDASSFDLYRITHPGTDNEFYPAAWHAIVYSTVEATGQSIPVATNAVWIAVQSAIWAPGIALLASVIVRRRPHLAAAVAVVAAAGIVGFPDLLLVWGTLYPNALAYALLPAGLALTVVVLRRLSARDEGDERSATWTMVALLVVWLIASSFAHPRSLFGYLVLVAPLAVAEGARAVRASWRRPERRRRILVILGACVAAVILVGVAGTVYVYRAFDVAQRPISDHLNGGPATATQGFWTSVGQALSLAPPSPDGSGQLPGSWALAVLVLAGVVVALIHPGTRWIAVAWAVLVILYALAAGSNSDLAKVLTGVWYKDKFRLFALLPVVQAPLVALAIVEAVYRARGRVRVAVAAICVAVLGIAIGTSNIVGAPSTIRRVFALPAHLKGGLLVDDDEMRLLRALPRHVPARAVIAGDPWDGSALSWAIGDRRALFPHVAGEWSADQLLVAGSIDTVRTDPAVCAAVHRLGISWVVEDPELLWTAPVEAGPFLGFHRAVRNGVLIPVAQVGSAGLYRIPACDPAGG